MEEKYWKQFENSGRIEDYLSFVNSMGRDTGDVPFMGDGMPVGGAGARGDAQPAEGVYSVGDVSEFSGGKFE